MHPSVQPLAKSDYINFSEVGPIFKMAQVMKNMHELNPESIPNALRQMAYHHIFILLSMLMADSMNTIHDNISNLYTKQNTGLSAGKYILNPNIFPCKDTLTK